MTAFDVLIIPVVAILAVIILRAWLRHRRDLRDLMDTGDGQGGVPPLQRCHRCRTGSTAFACTCEDDCYAPACNGWVAGSRPAPGCRWCMPVMDARADCRCAVPCGDPRCGALLWIAVSNTEEWER